MLLCFNRNAVDIIEMNGTGSNVSPELDAWKHVQRSRALAAWNIATPHYLGARVKFQPRLPPVRYLPRTVENGSR